MKLRDFAVSLRQGSDLNQTTHMNNDKQNNLPVLYKREVCFLTCRENKGKKTLCATFIGR